VIYHDRAERLAMIRHVVLFKFKPGISWSDAKAKEAERVAKKVGDEVPDLRSWQASRNISDRPIAYDFVAIGLVDNPEGLERYMTHPYHLEAIRLWREISDWVMADIEENDATTTAVPFDERRQHNEIGYIPQR
jgi:hypothetical protein